MSPRARQIASHHPAETDDAPGLTPLAELQLVEAHRRGDPDAVGALLGAYQRRIYAVCYRMLRDEHDARDLAQETMLKILAGLDSYDGRAKLSTWVIRIAMNCCLSHLRKRRLRRHGSLDDARARAPIAADDGGHGELPPPAGVEQDERRRLVALCLRGLDPQMRAVLVLRDMQDLEYDQIAEVLSVPVGTVKSRLFRARLALRRAMESRS